jgi:hypothetical protein
MNADAPFLLATWPRASTTFLMLQGAATPAAAMLRTIEIGASQPLSSIAVA